MKLGNAYGKKHGHSGGDLWTDDMTSLLRGSVNPVTLELTNDYALNRPFAVLTKDSLPNLRELTVSEDT